MFGIVLSFIVLFLGLTGLDIWLISEKIAIDTANVWNWGWILLSAKIIYLLVSFKKVGPENKGIILLLGKPICEVGSGLRFLPWLICSLQLIPKRVFQFQIPGEPEEIDKSGEDGKALMEGKKCLPIRVTTASEEIVKKDPVLSCHQAFILGDPLGQRMTLEPTAIVRFRVKDSIKFIQTIGSMDEAKKQLRDTVETVIRNEFAKRTTALIIADRAKIDEEMRKAVETLVGNLGGTSFDESWGIHIDTAQLVDVDINKSVNQALKEVAAAKITAKKTQTVAEAEKNRLIELGEGEAQAVKKMLFAKAEGQEKLAATAKTKEGRFALSLQTASETAQKAQYSIVGTDGMSGVIAAAMETLERMKKKDKKEV